MSESEAPPVGVTDRKSLATAQLKKTTCLTVKLIVDNNQLCSFLSVTAQTVCFTSHSLLYYCMSENIETERIRKQLYMSCRGFSSAQSRAWTNSWMKFTCKLWTKALPSAIVRQKQAITLNQYNLWSTLRCPTKFNIHLTSSLFVLHKDLQLQQPPRNIRIISHHGQSSLKLSLHTKLNTAVSYINAQK